MFLPALCASLVLTCVRAEFNSSGSGSDSLELQSGQCTPLALLLEDNLQVRYASDGDRDRALFSCLPGYFLSGLREAVCEYGQWNIERLPTCTAYCSQPEDVENGGLDIVGSPVEGLGYPNGTTAIYLCAQDYQLDPDGFNGHRVCVNGAWTGQPVNCVKKGGCSPDGTLVNGYLFEEKDQHRVRYQCQHGYQLDGPQERKCLGGVWIPPYMPKCTKKSFGGILAPSESSEDTVESGRSCASAPVVPGATLVWVRGPLTTNGVSNGAELEFQCNEGLRNSELPCEPSKIRCFNGEWHGRPPKCEEFDGCLPLPGIPHGALFGLAADGRYRVGARVAYTCQPGYRLRGTPVFSCEPSGCWEPAMLPDCTPEDQPVYLSGFGRGWEEYALSPGAALLASLGTALAVMALLMAVCLAVVCRRRRSSGGRSGRSTSGGRQRSSRLHHWPEENQDSTPQTPPSMLPPDPDRVALIAFADGLQVGQSVLPSYEEATRERGGGIGSGGVFYNALHRGRGGPQWTALSSGSGGRRGRRHQLDRDTDTLSHHSLHGGICTRQSSSTSHSASLRSYAVDLTGSTDTMAATSDGSTTVTLDTVSSHGASSLASGSASCRAICGSLASFDTSSIINTDGVPLLEEENELEAAGERPEEEVTMEEAATSEPKQGSC